MHHNLKTSLNLIAFHQTPLFNPKKKNTWYTPVDVWNYEKCNEETFNNIHSDLLTQMVLIPM